MTQEREQIIEMLFQELSEAFVGSVGLRVTHQLPHLHRQSSRHHFHSMRSHLVYPKTVAILEACKQQVLHSMRKRQRTTGPAFDQRITSSKQVREALVMGRRGEVVVHRPAVMSEDSRPVDAQQSLSRSDASGRVHFVTRGGQSSECMKPSPTSIDSPTRFISDHLRRTSYSLANVSVGVFEPIGGAKHASTTGATTDMNFKKHFQQTLDLTVAETKLFVQKCHRGVDVRSQLNSSGPDGVGGLQFVPALDMRSAATAGSRVDVELSVDDHARNIGLELNERVGLGQFVVATVWAARRQRHIVGFVNLFGHRSSMVVAMFLAALASRLLRIGFAFLAERSRLAFAFAFNFFKTRREHTNLRLHLLDNLQQSLATGALGIGFGQFHDARHSGPDPPNSPRPIFRPVNKYNEDSVLRIKDSFLVKLRSIIEQFIRGLKRRSISAGSAKIEIHPAVFRAAETEFVNRLCDELQSFFEKCQHGGIESPAVLLVGGASRISGLTDILNEICPQDVFPWESADFATVLGAVEYPGNEVGFESARQRRAQASYIESLKVAISDGRISRSEFIFLRKLSKDMSLPRVIADRLEKDILGVVLSEVAIAEDHKPFARKANQDLVSKVRAAIQLKNLDGALELLQIALDSHPNVPEYLSLKASVYLKQKKYKLAVSAATATLKFSANDLSALYARGRSLFMLSLLLAAQEDMALLLETSQIHKQEARFYLSSIAYRTGSVYRSLKILEEIQVNASREALSACNFSIPWLIAFLNIKLEDVGNAILTTESLIPLVATTTEESLEACVIQIRRFHDLQCSDFRTLLLGAKAIPPPKKDRTLVCNSCGRFECYDGHFCDSCNMTGSPAIKTFKLMSTPQQAIDLLAKRVYLLYSAQVNGRELGKAYARSCSKVGLSVRCIEKHGDAQALVGALLEAARLHISKRVSLADLLELGGFVLQSQRVDVQAIRTDVNVSKVAPLVQMLTPKLIVAEDHGAIINQIIVTNVSMFAIHALDVRVSVTRIDGSTTTNFLSIVSLAVSHRTFGSIPLTIQDGLKKKLLQLLSKRLVKKVSFDRQPPTQVGLTFLGGRKRWNAPSSCTRRYESLGWGIGIGDSQCCWSEAVGRTEAALRSANSVGVRSPSELCGRRVLKSSRQARAFVRASSSLIKSV